MELTLEEIYLKYIENYNIQYYDKLFSPMRYDYIKLLKLGINTGRLLAMLSEYFQNCEFHCVDINLRLYNENIKKFEKLGAFRNDDVHIYEYDITKNNFKTFITQMPLFDIIIDESFHKDKVRYENFLLLFPLLKKNGYYIIEEIGKPLNFIKKFSNIIAGFTNKKSKFTIKHKLYPIITHIDSIKIKQNLIIFKKN